MENSKYIKDQRKDKVSTDTFPNSYMESIQEMWNEIWIIKEQNEKLQSDIKLLDEREKAVSSKLNEVNRKLDLLLEQNNISDPAKQPSPRDISYWVNFGHFPWEVTC